MKVNKTFLSVAFCSAVALAATDVDAEILKDLEFFEDFDLILADAAEEKPEHEEEPSSPELLPNEGTQK